MEHCKMMHSSFAGKLSSGVTRLWGTSSTLENAHWQMAMSMSWSVNNVLGR